MSPQLVEYCQVAGALLVLAGFAGEQLGRLDARSLTYLLLNIVGAGTLAVVAYVDRDWGFLLLEGSWAIISLASMPRRLSHNVSRDVACGSPKPAVHSSASAGGWSP